MASKTSAKAGLEQQQKTIGNQILEANSRKPPQQSSKSSKSEPVNSKKLPRSVHQGLSKHVATESSGDKTPTSHQKGCLDSLPDKVDLVVVSHLGCDELSLLGFFLQLQKCLKFWKGRLGEFLPQNTSAIAVCTMEQRGIDHILNMPDVPRGQLPPHLEVQRTRVKCTFDAPLHAESIQSSGAYASMGIDNSLRLDDFGNNFRVEVKRLTEDDMEFDMIGIDASLANAFRRILIAEVPTMAIEKVLIANNTSVVQDEVLSHRLGLIPIKADPRLFEYVSENDSANEKNTIVFKLDVRCKKGGSRLTVKSGELIWLPNGSEFQMGTADSSSKPKTYTSFSCSQDSLPEFSNNPLGPKHQDIIISKLGPGQAIELEAHAVKGVGKTHAKWSPVSTTWYRMHPEVVLLQEVEGQKAEELVKKCPVDVFDIEELGRGRKKATVARPRNCTLCRECIRGDDWEKFVELRRVKDHFIFTIESSGALPPEILFTEAVKILQEKCERIITQLS